MQNSVPIRPSLLVSTSDNPVALNLVFAALQLQTRAPAEILVADDGSDDQTTAILATWAERFPFRLERLWQPHEGFRKTVILNRAVRAATGDYLIFLDGDCLPHRRFIADHLRHAERGAFVQGRRAGIRSRYVRYISARHFHPIVLFLQRRLYGLKRGLRRPWAGVRINDRSFIQGCNFAVWRDDFVRVNGYDETFVGWGHEDTELAERLCNAGLTCKTIIGQAIVYHLDHARVPHYRTVTNERILERTKREHRTRCEHGLAPQVPAG
jgi:glycosyltransferase involved in cell wall biosynthesis